MALVFAVRDFFADQVPTKGLPELHVKGLADDPARELLASLASTPIPDGVATKVIAATAGNPLALTGLAKELTESQLAGLSPLPDPLPTGELIEARFARQVQLLPQETQIALLLAAAEPTRDLVTIDRAAGELGTSLARSSPPRQLQLITTESGIEFRHPLIRSAVYSSASAARRREIHLALAAALDEATDPERWAMHRALAAIGPDEEVAAALEESAGPGSGPRWLHGRNGTTLPFRRTVTGCTGSFPTTPRRRLRRQPRRQLGTGARTLGIGATGGARRIRTCPSATAGRDDPCPLGTRAARARPAPWRRPNRSLP